MKMTKKDILEKIDNTLKFENTSLNKTQENILLGVNKNTGEKIKPIGLNRDNKEELASIIYKHLDFKNWKQEVIKWLEDDDFWGSMNACQKNYIEVTNKTGRIKFIGEIYIINNKKHIVITKNKKDNSSYCFL